MDAPAALDARIRAAGLEPARMPRHVAIIMDGNGRWARARERERAYGHERGADTVKLVTEESVRLGLERLTLFAFSSENWKRPQREIDALLGLLEHYLAAQLPTMQEHGVRLSTIGRLAQLPVRTRTQVEDAVAATAANRTMDLCLALSYGGRDEIVDACRAMARAIRAGELDPETIDQTTVDAHLYAPGAPDVDLLIRTAGEERVSNFLLWQAHYAEYVFADPYWPDFTVADYHAALLAYQRRERRFGKI